ncbi:oxidoreductase [Xanthomarina sp. F1114]|uniref:WD40/YVTN/BNR-like repeat-containing protein n=1 Tax=Xanthomarina sp. F1114 TaxID=2996019 RepID=UPI00225E2B53|nr:oxidoreductase [Xanthomarina sp. F1114]MCX7549089.1 oxidoreductase [Xanthomarina sp. F1114]
MIRVIGFVIVFLIVSCAKKETFTPRDFNSVEVENILEDSLLSIRAIELLADKNLAFAANNGAYGLYDSNKRSWQISKQEFDSLDLQFRAVAHTSTDFFMLSVASPALLFKTGDYGSMDIVYLEEHPKAFYDAMIFWNEQEGIAIGDPTDECMSVIITRDAGKTWKKVPCNKLPFYREGEAAYAASNTNIAVVGDKTWVATGGKVSRIFYSADKGETWEAFETPIIQGQETTGMYSVDFYDERNGFAIGGDYTKPENNIANKMKTTDGGKTWQLVADGKEPGYRSCVQYIPNREGKELVAVGFKGVNYSKDGGVSWKELSKEGFYSIRFINDSTAYASGQGRISKLYFK